MQDHPFVSAAKPSWIASETHRSWLAARAGELFDFFQYRTRNPDGGFFDLKADGTPIDGPNPARYIHSTARMVHCYAAASLLGRPGSDDVVDHGMRYLWNNHRDAERGGYFWAVNNDGPSDPTKQGYGHAFVLLAASSAKLLGHPLADRMLADVTEILETRFWEPQHGAIAEEFHADWSPIANYRGQNSNMHLTEALMAAFEATGERDYLRKAESIATLIIGRHAAEQNYRVGEHFDVNWNLDKQYRAVNEMFRPSGTTPGHWLEWSRLILQLWVLGGKQHDWMPQAAEALFRRSVELGWDPVHGGFFYTLDWSDSPIMRHKLWWPSSEAVGAAAWLCHHVPSAYHEEWYRRVWSSIAVHHIDRDYGGWHEELTEQMQPSYTLFAGKADIYHAVQACLIPLFPATGSITRAVLGTVG